MLGLIASDAIDPELAALLWLLAERGVPLIVASSDPDAARQVRNAVVALIPHERRAADVPLAGGTVVASSLEGVLRVSGSPTDASTDLADDVRDLGVVLIVDDGRVTVAHYVRPVERDAAGHIQRRPPAILSARTGDGAADHFYWAFTDELATRAGMERDTFEDEHRHRMARLAGPIPADTPN